MRNLPLLFCLSLFFTLTNTWEVTGKTINSLDFITVEDGLSQSTVNALAQDNKGFLWIGTQDGLNYFDGHDFKVYKKDPFDPTSLSDNYITSLLIDQQEQIWVGTIRGGLNKFDPATQEFSHYTFKEKEKNSLSSNGVVKVYEDPQGNIWVGTNGGLNRLQATDTDAYVVQRYQLHDQETREKDTWEYITAIHRNSSGELLVGSLDGFHIVELDDDLQQISCKTFNFTKKKNRYLRVVTGFFELSPTSYIIGTSSGLYRWDSEADTYEYIELPGLPGKASRVEINKLLSIGKDQLLVATMAGTFNFSVQDGFSSGVQVYPTNSKSQNFQTPAILDLQQDKLHPGLIWLGTNLSGLVKVYPEQMHFTTDHLTKVSRRFGVSPSVFHILEDEDQQLWIGLEGGILIKNEAAGTQNFYPYIHTGDKIIRTRFVNCFYKDSNGVIWAGTPSGILKLYIQRDELHGTFYPTPEHFSNWLVMSIYEDGPYLYLGSINDIFLFDRQQEEFIDSPIPLQGIPQYSESETPPGKEKGFRIATMHRDQLDRLWVGCANGVFVFSDLYGQPLQAGSEPVAKYYYQHPKHENSLSDNMVNQVIEDQEGQIWIATMNGMAKAITRNDSLQFLNYYEKHGLANNVVYGILPEPQGNHLWLSTNNGLSRFHTTTQDFYNYKKRDGLQSSEFNDKAFYISQDGRLVFGGIKGYTTFRPEEVTLSTYSPPVWITSLTTFNGSYYYLLNESKDKPVILDHGDNSFAVHFTGLDFLHPTEVEYYYDLEGGTAKDVHLGRHQKIEFNQLAPGKYNLCVKAKGKDGVFNTTGDSLQIHILTPYWQQSWFYWLCAGGILLISSLIYHTFYKIKMAQIAEIEQVRKAAAEDFHDELGSKLSIISMFSELTRAHLDHKDPRVATYLDRITTTSGSLYESMRDMLWALNPEQDTIRDLFFQLKDFGEQLFSHTSTAFHSTGIEPGWSRQNLPMQYKRHVLLICKEALHNSLRHANAEHVSLQMSYAQQTLQLKIKDDGKGCDLQTIERGQGITNMETRARRINGSFTIASDQAGTCITITCPLA